MNKGFTLVELLVVMVILSIIIIIAIPAYNDIADNVRKSNLETIKEMVKNTTINYATKHMLDDIKPSNNDCSDGSCCKYLSIRHIVEEDIFHSNDRRIINPVTNNDLEGYIKLTYNTKKYVIDGTYVENTDDNGNCEVIE